MDKEGRKFMTKRILIVDDAIFMRTMLKNILTKDVYKRQTCNNTHEH